jgi:acetyltransferase EpsM
VTARQKLIVLGSRAFAEEVADLVSDCDEYELVAFGENWDRDRCRNRLLGLPIIWVDELAPLAASHLAVCAIGTTHRSIFVKQAQALNIPFATVRHPTARVSRTSTVGPGSILSAGVIVAAHTTLGEHVIVNRGVLIGHHTKIGSYVTISPGANIAGRVSIGDGTYIGIGAIVLDSITVGAGSVVGAGSLVTKDVPDHVQVMGVPARVTKVGIEGR